MTLRRLLIVLVGSACCAMRLAAQPASASPVEVGRPLLAALSVADLNRSIEWYSRVLGFRVHRTPSHPSPGLGFAVLEHDGFYLEVMAMSGARPRAQALAKRGVDASLLGLFKFAYTVGNLDAAIAQLRTQGISLTAGPVTDSAFAGGVRYVLISDPDGNIVQLVQLLRAGLTVRADATGAQAEYIPVPGGAKLPFSEAVRVGNMLYLSGQLGTDSTGKVVAGGIGPETRQALDNIRHVLESNGSSLDHVVKCTAMLADMSEWPAMNEVYVTFFPNHLPARSAFGATALARGGRVEIECWAAR